MVKIISHRGKAKQLVKKNDEAYAEMEELIDLMSDDEEVLRKTTGGVDINFIDFGDDSEDH